MWCLSLWGSGLPLRRCKISLFRASAFTTFPFFCNSCSVPSFSCNSSRSYFVVLLVPRKPGTTFLRHTVHKPSHMWRPSELLSKARHSRSIIYLHVPYLKHAPSTSVSPSPSTVQLFSTLSLNYPILSYPTHTRA